MAIEMAIKTLALERPAQAVFRCRGRDRLPALVHEARQAPVRDHTTGHASRGDRVHRGFEHLQRARAGFGDLYERFRSMATSEDLAEAARAWEGVRTPPPAVNRCDGHALPARHQHRVGTVEALPDRRVLPTAQPTRRPPRHQQRRLARVDVWRGTAPALGRPDCDRAILREVVAPSMEVLPYDAAAAAWHAGRAGSSVSRRHNALLRRWARSPATALVNGCTLVTRNVRDFTRFRDLAVRNWFSAAE